MVVAEALDRISRDQEHVAGFYKELKFVRVQIVTHSEGKISELHIGLKGIMNAIFLTDLADKPTAALKGALGQAKAPAV